MGLVYGVIVGFSNDFFASRNYEPTRSAANVARSGSSPLILNSFVQGHLSALIAVILLLVVVFVAYSKA